MPIYINKVTLKKSKFGINMSVKTDEFIEQLRQHTNEKGYCNLEINERREVGKYGETHSMKVNEWKPTQKNEQQNLNRIDPNEPTNEMPF